MQLHWILPPVVRQKDRKDIRKVKAVTAYGFLQHTDLGSGFRGGLAIQKQSEHGVNIYKLKGYNHFVADPADDRIHFHIIGGRIFFKKQNEVINAPADLYAFGTYSSFSFFLGLNFAARGRSILEIE